MIAVKTESGSLLKVIPSGVRRVGYHPRFGFVTDESYARRRRRRERHGYKSGEQELCFEFVADTSADQLRFGELRNCSVEIVDDHAILSANGVRYRLSGALDLTAFPEGVAPDSGLRWPLWTGVSILLFVLLAWVARFVPQSPVAPMPEVIAQTVVRLEQEKPRKPVEIKTAVEKIVESVPELQKQAAPVKRAIKQDLGFLGLLGKKNLKNAVGGAPTKLKDASPGAGPGGSQGSGGESLTGLGEGLKRATVGNSGVAGLGGVGTKGAGGGLGGYGQTDVGSGEGRALASNPHAQDVLVDGGLDRAVIEATIAKYLSEIRACYEEGLRRKPDLTGTVTVAFEINGMGRLNHARVKSSTLGDPSVEACMTGRMMDWQFPQPRGGVTVKANHPFALRPAKA